MRLGEQGCNSGDLVGFWGGSNVCVWDDPGSGGHLGLQLKYKAALKPENARGSKGTHQQDRLPVQHRHKLSMLQRTGTRPTLTMEQVKVNL